jgi:hypothetical protein
MSVHYSLTCSTRIAPIVKLPIQQVCCKLHWLKGGWLAQNFSTENPSEPNWRQLSRMTVEINFVCSSDAQAAIGDVDGTVRLGAKVGKEIMAYSHELVLQAAHRRHARRKAIVKGLSAVTRKRVTRWGLHRCGKA